MISEDSSDEELMAAFQDKSVAAFDILYKRYYVILYDYFSRTLRPRLGDVAGELTNDVFLKLINKRHQYDPERAKFRPWILKIALNTGVDPFRSAEIFFRSVGRTLTEDPPTSFVDSISVDGFLKLLRPKERAVIRLLVLQELTAAEVARILNIPLGTVYSRKHNALRRLRKAVLKQSGSVPLTAPIREDYDI